MDINTGDWVALRIVMTRSLPRRITRRTPDLVVRPGKVVPRGDGRMRTVHVDLEPPTVLFEDRRTGWELHVSNGLDASGDHARRVDAHAAQHARSSTNVGILAGSTGRRASVDAFGPAVRLRRRSTRGGQLTLDLEVRKLTDDMHGRIQVCVGDWGLYRKADVDPVFARAGMRPAASLAHRGSRDAGPVEAYFGARIGGRP